MTAVQHAYRTAAAMVRAEAESIRVDLYASEAECDRLAGEKARLRRLAQRIEDEATGRRAASPLRAPSPANPERRMG